MFYLISLNGNYRWLVGLKSKFKKFSFVSVEHLFLGVFCYHRRRITTYEECEDHPENVHHIGCSAITLHKVCFKNVFSYPFCSFKFIYSVLEMLSKRTGGCYIHLNSSSRCRKMITRILKRSDTNPLSVCLVIWST